MCVICEDIQGMTGDLYHLFIKLVAQLVNSR